MSICFLDTETTSLRPDRRAWEIGLITRDEEGKDTEHSWFVVADELDLGNADLMSLKIGKFHDRHPQFNGKDDPWGSDLHSEYHIARDIEQLTRGATIVGAVPNFDTEVLSARMRAHGICPSWHYHLIDVETLAAGALKLPPPWSFDTVLATFGLAYDEIARHTALGDARMVRDLYDAILNPDLIRERAIANLGDPAREPGTVTGCACIDGNQTTASAQDTRDAAFRADMKLAQAGIPYRLSQPWCGNPDHDDPCDNCEAVLVNASDALRQRMPTGQQ